MRNSIFDLCQYCLRYRIYDVGYYPHGSIHRRDLTMNEYLALHVMPWGQGLLSCLPPSDNIPRVRFGGGDVWIMALECARDGVGGS